MPPILTRVAAWLRLPSWAAHLAPAPVLAEAILQTREARRELELQNLRAGRTMLTAQQIREAS